MSKVTPVPTFISKTWAMYLEKCPMDSYSWDSEGKILLIKKVDVFQNDVLPRYFKHSNIQSFVRQLHIYDFHKASTANPNHIGYANVMFRKNRPEILSQMKRKPPMTQAQKMHPHKHAAFAQSPHRQTSYSSENSDETLEDSSPDFYVMSPTSVRTLSDEHVAAHSTPCRPAHFNSPGEDKRIEDTRRKAAFDMLRDYVHRPQVEFDDIFECDYPAVAKPVEAEQQAFKRPKLEELPVMEVVEDTLAFDEDFRSACCFDNVGAVTLDSLTRQCSLDLGDSIDIFFTNFTQPNNQTLDAASASDQ